MVTIVASCNTGEPARTGVRGPPLVETRDFGSGARLHARAWEVDGALVLRDFFDSARGEACSFVEDGTWHIGPGPTYWCLPLRLAHHDLGFGPFALFSDSACTERVALSPRGGPATYAVVRPPDACASAPSVHHAGEPEMIAPWIFDGTGCRRAPAPLMVQRLGDAVPLESFARATERVEDRGSRIGSLLAVADDGAWMTLGAVDLERSEAVRIDEPRAGSLRWVPARVAFEGAGQELFGDVTCAVSVPTKIARDAVCPLTAVLVFEDECGAARFHALGQPLASQRLHARDARDACVPYSGGGVLAFELGAPLPPSALAPAFAVDVGGDEVRRRGYAGAGGDVATWGDLVDVATREPCTPTVAYDGSRRCLPVASASITLFADDACTIPAFEQPVSTCDAGTAPPRLVQSASDDGARVFEVTGEARELFDASSGSCLRHVSVVPSRGYRVREVGVARFPQVGERELP